MFRAARSSLAVVLAGLLAACGNSGGSKTVTVAPDPTVAPAPATGTGAAVDPAGTALETLADEINDALVVYRQRFAAGGRQGTLAQRRSVLRELSTGADAADKAVADAAAASPLGSTASGFTALRGVTQPLAAFLQDAAAAKTPAEVAASGATSRPSTSCTARWLRPRRR